MSIWICDEHGVVEDHVRYDYETDQWVCEFCGERAHSVSEDDPRRER